MKDIVAYFKQTPSVVVAIIIGLSILGYGYLDYKFKINTLDREQAAKDQRVKLGKECRISALNDYEKNWNAYCKVMDKSEKCNLPDDAFNKVNTIKDKAIDNCLEIFVEGSK